MNTPEIESTRPRVLRISHDVDDRGHVQEVQLQPLIEASSIQTAYAAWHAAKRCHPWIVGDDVVRQMEILRQTALTQVNELLRAADEFLCLVSGHELAGPQSDDSAWRDGYQAALKDLRQSRPCQELREGAIDMRGYLRPLAGQMPAIRQDPERRYFKWTA